MTFSTLRSYVIPCPLCIPNTTWKFVGLLLKYPRVNVIQMLEKCWMRPLSKNVDAKAVRHFEENNLQGDDLHANRNTID